MTDKYTPAELPEMGRTSREPIKTLLICSDERTGSHFLAQHMAATGVLGRPFEYFNTPGMRVLYPDYPDELQEQLNIAKELGATENGVLGLKMHPHAMDRILPKINLDLLPDLRLIYLTREDILGQAISLAMAQQTQIWSTAWGRQSSESVPEYRGEDIRRISEELLHNRTRWELYFERNGISPLRVTYEDLVDRPQQMVESIADYADVVQRPNLSQECWYTFERQAGKLNEEWRQRYISEYRDMQFLDVVGRNPKMGRLVSPDEVRQHWAQADNFDLTWNERAKIAVDFLEPDEKWVCDIGCGPVEAVRALLPPDATYLAADLKQWGPHVALCDLNVPMLPDSEMGAADVCMFLGVFEYVADLLRALQAIAARCDTLIFSYCSTDVSSDRWWLWVNSYSAADILGLLGSVGYTVQKMVAYLPGQYVIRAKRLTGIPTETRLAARADYLGQQSLNA